MSNYKPGTDVDIVICGGGTAACVLAGRLQHADPNLSVLLIEQGRNNFNDPTVVNPAVYLSHLAPTSTNAIFYKSKASDHLGGREAVVPAGGMFGGGSSINFMVGILKLMYTGSATIHLLRPRAAGCTPH